MSIDATTTQQIIALYPNWENQALTQQNHYNFHQNATFSVRNLREQYNQPFCHRCNGIVQNSPRFNRFIQWLRNTYQAQTYSQTTADRFATLLATLNAYDEDTTDTALFARALREALELISAIRFRQVPADSKAIVANTIIHQIHNTHYFADPEEEHESGRNTPDTDPETLTIHDRTDQPI
jgi:hypothetical protein